MSDDNLHCTPEAATKVAYEMRMLRHSYKKLCQFELVFESISPGGFMPRLGTGFVPEDDEENGDVSAFIECFLLHARVLRYFFADKRQWDDDIIADDFVAGWKLATGEMSYIKGEKERIDKALAHLTTTRIEYDAAGEGWDIETIMEELHPVIERFRTELPADRKSWFEDI